MKIGLNMEGTDPKEIQASELRAQENLILNAQKGDWKAKEALANDFHHLLVSLAEKRTDIPEKTAEYIEAGKNGLFTATAKYKHSVGAGNFRIFALDYIENSMDRLDSGGGFLSRLFGKK